MRKAYAAELQKAEAELAASLDALRQKSGGGKGGTSWKAELSDTTAWAKALQTAAAHFNPAGEMPLQEQLDSLMKKFLKDYDNYTNIAEKAFAPADTDMEEDMYKVTMQGRITHCEAFFINVLISKDAEATKTSLVCSRVAKMTTNKIVAPTSCRKFGTACQLSCEDEPCGFAGWHGTLLASSGVH